MTGAHDVTVLTAVTFMGAVFGTLGSLYLTDGLLHRRYRSLRIASVVLSFGILYGVPYAVVSGTPAIGLVVGLGVALWFALRVMRRAPGGYYVIGAILGALGFGILCGALDGIAAGLTATLAVGLGGAIPLLAAVPASAKARAREGWRWGIELAPYVVLTGVAVVAGMRAGTEGFMVAGLGLVQGFASTFGPQLIHWTDSLTGEEIGAAGVVFILFGFLAQAVQPLSQMFGLSIH